MTDTEILEMLMADLEKRNPLETTKKYLMQLISVSKAEISREGIHLVVSKNESGENVYSIEDAQTVEMYAAYLYRKRTEKENSMPRMLRYRLNNRLLSEKLGGV